MKNKNNIIKNIVKIIISLFILAIIAVLGIFIYDRATVNNKYSINDENIEVHFLSNDQSINYTLICKKSDKFSDLQNKFYKKYPIKKDKKCFFLYKGCSINDEKKTVGENGIKNGDNILVVYLK